MDSLTQITLGAAVAEAIAGKKLGNKAIFWGAVGGTIPDLDILAFPFIDSVKELSFHRGESHAFFFILIFVPIIAAVIHYFYRNNKEAGYMTWFWLFFGSIITHPMLDVFTTFGTQIWLPFSRARVAIGSIFVADPLYTVPFLICVIAASRFHRSNRKRRIVNWVGIGLSSAYLCFTVFNKIHVQKTFKKAFAAQNISYKEGRLICSPTPLNNLLWQSVVESENGYYMMLYSILDKNIPTDYIYVERKEELAGPMANTHAFDEIKWFSDGYYTFDPSQDGEIMVSDLRFGMLSGWEGEAREYPFKFKVEEIDGKIELQQLRGIENSEVDLSQAFSVFWNRIWGQK